jgi:hypothetical protein
LHVPRNILKGIRQLTEANRPAEILDELPTRAVLAQKLNDHLDRRKVTVVQDQQASLFSGEAH